MIYFLSLLMALLPTYLVRLKIFGFPTTLLELLIVVFLFLTLFHLDTKGIKKIQSLGWINLGVAGLILAGIISTAISPDKIKALGQLKAFFIEPVLVFYAILLTIKSQDQYKVVLRWLFASTSLISAFGIVQYFTFFFLPLRFWGTGAEIERITSVFEYPNALALFLAPLFGFFFILLISNYKLFKQRWIEILGLILIASALMLTFSRGAIAAVIFTLGLILIKKYGFKNVVMPAVLITILLLMIPPVRSRVTLGLNDPSSQAHFDLMQIGAEKIISNPFFGNGLYGFRTTLAQNGFTGEILNYPHNIFLNFWLETGLLGLISFCVIVVFIWNKQKTPASPAGGHPSILTLAVGAFLFILILHGLVDVPYFKNDLSVLFWFIAAGVFI